MPDHDPSDINELDSRGEKLWCFSVRYLLPDSPSDNRDWFNAISTVDEEVHGVDYTGAWGSAWVKNHRILFLMKANGIYTTAHEAVLSRVNAALTKGGLAVSQLVEISYSDPDEPLDESEPPF